MSDNTPIQVVIDDDATLALAPQYLARRRTQIDELREALAEGDLEGIGMTAHKLRGSGGAYGFDQITEIATAMRDLVASGDAHGVSGQIDALEDYLNRVEVLPARS